MRREGGPSERMQKPYQTVRRHSSTPLPRRHGGGFKIVVDVLPALRGKDPEDVGEKGRNRRNGRSVVQIPFARQSSRSGNIEIMCKAAFRTAPREARKDHESRSRPVGVMLELSWYRFWSFGGPPGALLDPRGIPGSTLGAVFGALLKLFQVHAEPSS